MVLGIEEYGKINDFFGGFAYEGKTTASNGVVAGHSATNGAVANGSTNGIVPQR